MKLSILPLIALVLVAVSQAVAKPVNATTTITTTTTTTTTNTAKSTVAGKPTTDTTDFGPLISKYCPDAPKVKGPGE
ncbi:hypothetical protein BC936DRAFT_147687 [Jimgerdemannia flammicorona]|uniref:Uncharacterized protein n=1 Tax=Jimgerdemannia flammicorona TaxID=994334 RepID=A0A433D4P4_9FUNG|nr:hypothetical protein BC936DRAFT_147687 [Jimgerdemannia flammicorona]